MWRLRFCMQNVCSLCPSLLHTPTLVTWQFRVPLRKNTTRSHDIVCRFPKCEHFSQRFWVIRPNFCQSRRKIYRLMGTVWKLCNRCPFSAELVQNARFLYKRLLEKPWTNIIFPDRVNFKKLQNIAKKCENPSRIFQKLVFYLFLKFMKAIL